MIRLNQLIVPRTAPRNERTNAQIACSFVFAAAALLLLLTWCQPSHASNIWLWSWLGAADTKVTRCDGNQAGKGPAAAAAAKKISTAATVTPATPAPPAKSLPLVVRPAG